MPDDLPSPGVSNHVEDASGQVVQIGNVYGDVKFHAAARPALPLRAGRVPLRAASFQQRSADLFGPVTVLSGLGGVGKTQLAADHAERRWATGEVQLLAWVTAGSREAIVSSYADAAAKLTGWDDPDPERGARTLLEWLAGSTASWLVVLDDLQVPADLTGLWPPVTDHGQVVVTTRRRDAALRGHQRRIVEVGVFSEVEALAYLRTLLADQRKLLDAENLVRDLGNLPLALAQAGAYMADKHLSCAEYRARLAERRLANVLPDVDGLPDEHRATVAATWSLSLEQADGLVPQGVARPLLEVAGVLDANGIPLGAFTTPAVLSFLTATTGRTVDAHDARDGLGCLHRLSLITLDTGSEWREVRVHALVQRATRDTWSRDRADLVIDTAVQGLLGVWPDVMQDAVLRQALCANADALALAGGGHVWREDRYDVLTRTGNTLGESGLVAQARNYYAELHDTAVQRLGPDHLGTLTIRDYLARWQGAAGDAAGSATAYRQLVADCTRVLGPDHPRTFSARSGVAHSLGETGDPAGAAAAFRVLLADQLRVLGPDHRYVLRSRNNVAHFQGMAGDAAGAAAAFQELLADQLRVLGPDFPQTLRSRNNLAHFRGEAGDLAGATAAFEELLTDQARILGPDHPNTLTTRGHLARLRQKTGDVAGATAAFEELLADQLRVLGPDHPATVLTSRQLGRRKDW